MVVWVWVSDLLIESGLKLGFTQRLLFRCIIFFPKRKPLTPKDYYLDVLFFPKMGALKGVRFGEKIIHRKSQNGSPPVDSNWSPGS